MTVGEGNLYAVRFRGADERIIGREQVAAVSKHDAVDIARAWQDSLPLRAHLKDAYVHSFDVYVRKVKNPNDLFLVRYP